MKILFIGGTGNISTAVSRQLLGRSDELWLMNRTGEQAGFTGANWIQADINNLSDLQARTLQAQSWDVVVNWVAFTADDVQRDIRLFGECSKQYVFISSASCYQNPGPTGFITERTPLENPFWEYSRNKIAAEQALMAAFKNGDINPTIVRPSHTYSRVIPLTIGGWDEYTTMARIKQGKPIVVQGDGTSLWTLTHADDFARGFIGLLGNPGAFGEDFHITSDEFLSWDTIYQLTAAAVGCEANIVHVTSDQICRLDPDYRGSLLGDKAVSAIFDNSKIKKLVPSFEAKISYAEGIKRTIEWFEAHPGRQLVNLDTNTFIERLIATTA